MTILQVNNLVKHYGKDNSLVRAVDDISLYAEKGEFISVVGKSGSGKSTLLHLIGGLESEYSGTIIVNGNEIGLLEDEELSQFRRREIGFIFQSYNLLPILSVRDNIVLPLGLDRKKADSEYFHEVISMLEIIDKLDTMPNCLSGGEQQRVAIARALMTKPTLILADEPTGNLDFDTGEKVVQLIQKTGKRFEQTIIMVTHSKDAAKRADRMVCLEKGKIAGIV